MMKFLAAQSIGVAASLMLLAIGSSPCHAAIVFSNGFQADFKFTIIDGPLASNDLPVGTVLDFTAVGTFSFELDDSGPVASTMPFTNVTGTLEVTAPGGFAGALMSPYGFQSGQLKNINRDALGSIVSADIVDLSVLWQMQLGATRLYTVDTLLFQGTATGLPLAIGDVLSGPAGESFLVYMGAGAAGDPTVVTGGNRVLSVTAVPEPGSLALLSLGGLGLLRFRQRKGVTPPKLKSLS